MQPQIVQTPPPISNYLKKKLNLLKYPQDKILIEALNIDDLFDWFSGYTRLNSIEYFKFVDSFEPWTREGEEALKEFNAWWDEMYRKKKSGTLFKRIKAALWRSKKWVTSKI